MKEDRWNIIIRLISQSVINEHSGFWEYVATLSPEAIAEKDIISKDELLIVIDVLKRYKP